MQRQTADSVQAQLAALARRIGPVLSAVAATLLVIVGVLVISYPELLSWAVGIGLILAGVGLLAAVVTATVRPSE